jgi:hypothetical protein
LNVLNGRWPGDSLQVTRPGEELRRAAAKHQIFRLRPSGKSR